MDKASQVAHLPLLRAEKGWTNPGHAVLGLIRHTGFDISADGRKLSRRADPSDKLSHRETAAPNTQRPAEQRQTAVGGLDAINLEHDAVAPIAGTRAAQAAAAATRPPAPLALELVRPAAGERIGRIGTGWGNVPRAVERRPAPAAPVVEVSGVSGGLAPI